MTRAETSGLGLMARRTIVVDGNIWKVYPAGRLTVYGKDEFSLVFALELPGHPPRC